jgi:hypothetical protein
MSARNGLQTDVVEWIMVGFPDIIAPGVMKWLTEQRKVVIKAD